MFKKICSLLLAAVLIIGLMPMAFSVSDAQISLIVSPDSQHKKTVNVTIYAKCSEKVSENGVFAYFSFNTEHLQPVDSLGEPIDYTAFTKGVTFIANDVQAFTLAEGWSDESSFIKQIGDKIVFGFEIAPESKTEIAEGVQLATARFALKNDGFSSYNKAWITPVTEQTGELAFPAAIYTENSLHECASSINYTPAFETIVCEHDWGSIIYEDPKNAADGKAYYICSKCLLKTAVNVSDEGELSPVSKDVELPSELSENTYSVIPCASANDFNFVSSSGRTSYDSRNRGTAIRCTEELDIEFTTMRFANCYQLPTAPENSSENEAKTLKIVDFGIVYCLSDSLLKSGVSGASEDVEKLDAGKLNIDGITGNRGTNNSGIDCNICSLKNPVNQDGFRYSTFDNDGNYTGSSIEHTQNLSEANYVTFNLVIRVHERYYERFYASRAYITYEYLGKQFTLYDTDLDGSAICSSRSVLYVAQKALSNPQETEANKDYIYRHIISPSSN